MSEGNGVCRSRNDRYMTKMTLEKVRDYFYGRCSTEEELQLQKWFAQNASTPQADALLHDLFEEIHVKNPVLAGEAFRRFCTRIGREVPTERSGGKTGTVLQWSRRVAAVLIIPLLAALAFLYTGRDRTSEWKEVFVPMGERSRLELADGTQLWLNSGTRVTYPVRFCGRQRKIFVDGEVFAEVTPDKRHPFLISAGEIGIEVLGTRFNMRAYNTDSSVEVVLVDGSVRFDVNSPKCAEQVTMVPNQIVHYDRLTGTIEKSLLCNDNYASRAQGGGFYFFNESLASIAAQLARSFNRKIIIADPDLEQMRFYALFTNNESLDKILETFSAGTALSIREKDSVIYLFRKR